MSADTPQRPDPTDGDDLAQAYARAQALADDGHRPSAAVRANVLAAAHAIAQEAAEAAEAAAATLPLTPVAPPVSAVGQGRPRAINLSSWRVRSGAALCAVLIVGLAGWRFDESRRLRAGDQVAMAELRMAEAPTAPVAHDLPAPALSGASYPDAPAPVVDDRADAAPAAKQAARDKAVIVAQLDQKAENLQRSAAAADAVAPARRALAAPAAPTPVAADAAAAAPGVVAANAPQGESQPSVQDPTTVTVRGPAATQLATTPAMPPSVLQRRVAVVPKPAPEVVAQAASPMPAPAAPVLAKAGAGDTVVAAAEAERQRVDVTAGRPGATSDAAKKAAPSSLGSLVTASARLAPTALHAAADRGDVEALRRLLENTATPVDSADAAGRTALLHAVLAQQVASVRLLLAAGADPARADHAGLTPRAAAQTGANAEIAALLGAPR